MRVTLSPFHGLFPRYADHVLMSTAATAAHDVKLRNGVLEPWQENCPFADAVENARSFHIYGCCAVSWEDIVTVGELPPDWKRFYIVRRDGNGLEAVEMKCECQPVYYKGGVPAPPDPPAVSCTEECDRTADARAYVYTYVNKWGEESAPSPPSDIVRVKDGTTVTVSNIQDPPDGYGIVSVYLYRATTAYREVNIKTKQTPQTAFLLVAILDVPLESSVYEDEILALNLGPACETEENRMPPAMDGVLSVGDKVQLVGWRDNHIFRSAPFEPHNWPARFDLTLDHTIVHMGEMNGRLFVTTDAYPYIVDITDCDDTHCNPVTKVLTPLPDIGCNRANGAVMTPHGLFYASPVGIILLAGDGSWAVSTSQWFGEEEWRKLQPDQICMAWYEGYLFFSTPMGTFLLDVNSTPYGDAKGGELVTLSDAPIACETTNTGALAILQDGEISIWSGGDVPREYVWRSRPLTGGISAVGFGNLAAAHGGMDNPHGQGLTSLMARGPKWAPLAVKLGGRARVRIENPHGAVFFDRFLSTERPVRVARCGRHLYYNVEIRGSDRVEFLDMGSTFFTVNEGQ